MRYLILFCFWFAGVAVWIAAFYGLIHIVAAHKEAPETNPIGVVAYIAGMVALAGWMVQAFIAVRNSRKQHTMNVLFQTRIDPKVEDHVKNIEGKFPVGVPITYKEITKKGNEDEYDSVRWILNYYEFVATGIRHGDLDEAMMKDCIGTLFCSFCNKSNDVIKTVRGESEYGNPEYSKRRILASVRWLQKKWAHIDLLPH